MKRTIKDWLLVLASLLDDAAAVLLILLVLWFLKIPISLSIIFSLALLFVALVFVMHKFVIPALRSRVITGSEGMVGLEGMVVKSLAPIGTISVKGEYWKAKSIGDNISTGEHVEILAVNGLTLHVKGKRV